ncbi:aarF domain-containing kinase [Sporothrix brasiliensis 5110]|uniref:AarF domain-containing kinase n=1 Tax=Sporothrix brasiliensis 5110 TaxID=1398154 RepID=A0A0C2J002_9PEZI|nr:aarF domain-containing kinase [Sporothrix brasiliensis 5110]KIH94646.1 aarF domain-containing kinase [Sporothrix brasiliensis 5110]
MFRSASAAAAATRAAVDMAVLGRVGVARHSAPALRPVTHHTPFVAFQRRGVQSRGAGGGGGRGGNGGPFQAMRPPTPAELGGPRKARDYPRMRRWGRRLLVLGVIGGAVYLVDRQVYASGMARSLRTFGTGLVVALDYKINFRADPLPIIGTPGDVADLHRRNAERLSELLRHNGGLYLKIGQAIAMQSAVLPPEFQRMFGRMFDDAPQDTWAAVEKVVREDFGGRSVEEVFGVSFTGEAGKGVMERKARASASVAQVHWARLPDGREVAVKIQKPEIAKQIGWDLWAFKAVAKVYSYWFDLPLYSLVPFVSERLMLETDFLNEAKNSETMRDLINNEPALRGRVYVPPVYYDFSSHRVLTTEWIEGVRLWDQDAIQGAWRGGSGVSSPGVHGAKLPSPDMDALRNKVRAAASARGNSSARPGDSDVRDSLVLKPERTEWRGPRGKGGLGLSTTDVMSTMIDLFSAQMFKWGVVHCDPHPGNMFVRRKASGQAELVLIDHGLYVYMSPTFRHQYSVFWKAMLTLDHATVAATCAEWGIQAPELFASSTMLRPYEGGDDTFRRGIAEDLAGGKTASERHYAMQARMKQGMRDIMADEEKWPKEFIFLGRNLRIVQANNQRMGSPVNRVKRIGRWASASLYEDRAQPWRERLANMWRHVVFSTVLAVTDAVFYFYRVRQFLGGRRGLEDQIEAQMKGMAKEYGVELQHEVFDG